MSTEITDAFINAVLADASYVDGLTPGETGSALTRDLGTRLTAPVGSYIGSKFSVVAQHTEGNWLESGFSVTVWRELETGKNYISFRGTEGLSGAWDVVNDLNAFLASGLAESQVLAMVNWYLRATAARGSSVPQFRLGLSLLPETYTATATGELQGAGPFTVNGHSLGGHLSTVFTRLFGDVVVQSNTYRARKGARARKGTRAMVEY